MLSLASVWRHSVVRGSKPTLGDEANLSGCVLFALDEFRFILEAWEMVPPGMFLGITKQLFFINITIDDYGCPLINSGVGLASITPFVEFAMLVGDIDIFPIRGMKT